MLTVGDKFPEYAVKACVGNTKDDLKDITTRTNAGQWQVFIFYPKGTIQWVSVNPLSFGRSVPEVLRVLDAIQSDELCPCNWQKGQPTLKV